MKSFLNQWFKSDSYFNQGVDCAYWWSCTGKYTYYEIFHKKSMVMSQTGLGSIVRTFCQKPIRPLGGPLGGPRVRKNS